MHKLLEIFYSVPRSWYLKPLFWVDWFRYILGMSTFDPFCQACYMDCCTGWPLHRLDEEKYKENLGVHSHDVPTDHTNLDVPNCPRCGSDDTYTDLSTHKELGCRNCHYYTPEFNPPGWRKVDRYCGTMRDFTRIWEDNDKFPCPACGPDHEPGSCLNKEAWEVKRCPLCKGDTRWYPCESCGGSPSSETWTCGVCNKVKRLFEMDKGVDYTVCRYCMVEHDRQ